MFSRRRTAPQVSGVTDAVRNGGNNENRTTRFGYTGDTWDFAGRLRAVRLIQCWLNLPVNLPVGDSAGNTKMDPPVWPGSRGWRRGWCSDRPFV